MFARYVAGCGFHSINKLHYFLHECVENIIIRKKLLSNSFYFKLMSWRNLHPHKPHRARGGGMPIWEYLGGEKCKTTVF